MFVPSLDRDRHSPLVHFRPPSLRTNHYRSLQLFDSIFWLSVENVQSYIIWESKTVKKNDTNLKSSFKKGRMWRHVKKDN